MSETNRRWAVRVVGLAGLAALAWYALREPAAAVPSAGPTPAFPNLWQWQVNRLPTRDRTGELHLVLRSQSEAFPSDRGPGPPRRDPLGPGEGSDRTLLADALSAIPLDQFRVGAQLIDLRTLGVRPADGEPPLRLAVAYLAGESGNQTSFRPGGFTPQAVTPHPTDRWVEDELPLLTFVTLGEGEQHTYTLLLAIRDADSRPV